MHPFPKAHSQDFTLGATNRGAEWGEEWGDRLEGLGERRELSQRDPGRSPGRQRIFWHI